MQTRTAPRKTVSRRRSTRTPQQARSRQTRIRILEAALLCFEERGFDETTTAEIARRADIAVGTLYGYFPDKRILLLELLQGTATEIADYLVDNLNPERWLQGDPRESVRSLIDALFHTRTFNPGMQRIVWERYFKDPDFRNARQAVENRVRGAILALLQELHRAERLRIQDLETAAFVIYTSVEWTASRLMLGGAGANIDEAVDVVSDMVSRFLFPDRRAARLRASIAP